LTKLPDALLRAALADGRIHPGLKQKEVRLLRGLLPAGTGPSKTDGQTGAPPDPIMVWASFSAADKCAILDSEGRSGLAKLLSPELMLDLVGHSLRQEMVGASTKLKPAVSLTSILRATLDPTSDSSVVFGRFKAKLKGLGLDLHDVSIALKKRGKR